VKFLAKEAPVSIDLLHCFTAQAATGKRSAVKRLADELRAKNVTKATVTGYTGLGSV